MYVVCVKLISTWRVIRHKSKSQKGYLCKSQLALKTVNISTVRNEYLLIKYTDFFYKWIYVQSFQWSIVQYSVAYGTGVRYNAFYNLVFLPYLYVLINAMGILLDYKNGKEKYWKNFWFIFYDFLMQYYFLIYFTVLFLHDDRKRLH